ncbi:MAG: PQQ-dependent sugar dehydrogenase [Solirubrobacteraceae bacterium]
MSPITRALLALTLLALAAPAGAAAAPAYVRVGTFDQPIHVASPPDDRSRLMVVQRPGVIRVVRNGTVLATPFLDITSDVRSSDDERGLLSIAFPPDYERSGLFYVYMTANPDGQIQVREYHRSAVSSDRADPGGRVVWSADHTDAANHNGGQLDFGPDGKLWFATGDGGGSDNQFGHARDLGSPLGKLLRIDPQPGNGGDYTIPADNPFSTALWAYGLRNPFRFSFDSRGSKDLFIGDVGQGAKEEIDWARFADGLGKGADFGWSCREGTVAGPTACATGANYLPPIFDYDQPSPRAVTGGVVVRDPGLPTLFGRYVYADAYTALVHSFVPATPRATGDRDEGLPGRRTLASFGEDACGHVYVVSIDGGSVDRIQDGAVGACVLRPGPAAIPNPPPPAPPAAPAVPDRTSPRVRIGLARKGRVGLRATPRITLTATEPCRVTVTARVGKLKFKRVRTPLRGGRRTVLRLRPSRSGANKLRRTLKRHRRVTLVVSVVATDAAGNTGRVKRRVKIRRG